MVSSLSLTTPASSINRTKYFPIELYCTGMLPNTTYDAYVDGQLVNAFCKPYGGKLGDSLTSNGSGKLTIQYMLSIQFKQQFLVNPTVGSNSLVRSQKTITLVDPYQNASTSILPIQLKSA